MVWLRPEAARRLGLQYSFSQDEHAAMARYLSGIRKQLQDVSDLVSSRYGKNTSIAEITVKTLVSATLLEHELLLLENGRESESSNESQSRSVGNAVH